MDDQKSKQKLEAVRNLLGEPVFIGFSDYVLKLRRNLVALAMFIIFYQWLGLKIVNVFGLVCNEVPRYKINIFLAIYLGYTSVYFFSEAWEAYLRWKIRLSGTFKTLNQPKSDDEKPTVITRDLNVEAIKLKDIGYCHGEQSYLYSIMAQAIYANLDNLKDLSDHKVGDQLFAQEGGPSKEEFFKERRSLTSLDILEIVKTGLERFQKGFCNFQKWQIGRFLFFDILTPLALMCIAFYMLYKNFYFN